MSRLVEVDLISSGYQPQPVHPPMSSDGERRLTTNEWAENCEKAAKAYGMAFFEYIKKEYGDVTSSQGKGKIES